MTQIDTTKTIELEQKYDPEMRFRPLVHPASLVVGVLLIVLSCFHYYTAGFGLLRETTHRGIHLAFVLGLIFLVFPARKSLLEKARRHSLVVAGRRAARRLGARARDRVVRALHPVDLRRPRVPRRQSAAAGRRDGLDPRRAAARGDAAGDGLAAAGDRDRLHDLRARRAGLSGPAPAFGGAVVEPRQPPVPDEPGHLRHRRRRGRDVTCSTSCCSACWRRASAWASSSSTSRRRSRGATPAGPAKVSVFASALFGMLSGSSVANAVTVGSLTIPAMIRLGYPRHFAGAVEAASSTGGQITPPIMGAAAFLMIEFLNLPYQTIIIAAIVPAFMHFFGVFMQVHFEAKRRGLRGLTAGGAARPEGAGEGQLADADPARAAHRHHHHRLDAVPRRVHRASRRRRSSGCSPPAAGPPRGSGRRSPRVTRCCSRSSPGSSASYNVYVFGALLVIVPVVHRGHRRQRRGSRRRTWSRRSRPAPSTRWRSAPRRRPSASSSASSR